MMAIALLLMANAVILADVPRLLGFVAGLILMCLLPGYLAARIVLPDQTSDWTERAVLTVGMGFGALVLGALGLHYIPGPLGQAHLLILFDAISVVLIVVELFSSPRRQPAAPRHSTLHSLLPLALVLVAAFFRLANLGYSEFQGDESRAMLMAAGVIRGEDSILFLHRKGPVEILVPAAFYALDGTTTELVGRAPFALASMAGVLTIYAIARRLVPDRVAPALVAGGLLAVDGYLVAFGRLVQYQSIVFLMTALTAWCSYVWYREGRAALLALGAGFLAVGSLAHYEAILVVPFVAWLFCARGRQEGWSIGEWAGAALLPLLTFAVVAGCFYIPFVRHPHFLSDTAEYIAEDRIGGGLLYNNLRSVFDRATFYNSTYYILFLMVGGLVWLAYQLAAAIRPARWAPAAWTLVVLALAAGLVAPQLLLVQGVSLAAVPFAAVLLLLLASSGLRNDLKALVLWFAVPFIIALFLTDRPKTHVYTMFPAWAIMVGAGLARFGEDLEQVVTKHIKPASALSPRRGQVLRNALMLGGLMVLVLLGGYIYIVFVRHDPDFRRDGYPGTRPALYFTFYGDWSPSGGGFAFPHRGGWKGVGALYAAGELQGSFRSNEETITTSWYTRQAPWCADSPDYYFISHVTHDRWDIHPNRVRRENNLFGTIRSDGKLLLEIYTRHPVEAAVDYELAELEPVFDEATRSDVWLWALKSPVPQHRVDARLREDISLMGYDARPEVHPGGVLSTVLYWEPLSDIERYYNVFVHLEVEGEAIWAQSDEAPACGAQSTEEWEDGEVVVDGHVLHVSPDVPPGEYPLLGGLYDPRTGERVAVRGRSANEWGNAVRLGTIQVVEPGADKGSRERTG